MNAYIKLSTLEYPRYEGDIRLEYPEILESQTGETFVCPDTYEVVEATERPTYDGKTQIAYELPPQKIDGVWKMVWDVRNYTEDELLDFSMARVDTINAEGSAPDVIG